MEQDIQIVVLESKSHFTDAAVGLHRAVFPEEFIVSLGHRFLTQYYHAFAESPYGVVLAAVRGTDEVVGGLLGSVDPVHHYRRLTRRHGSMLALSMLLSALARPKVAKALVETRLKRYLTGVLRQLWPTRHRPRHPSGEPASQMQTQVLPAEEPTQAHSPEEQPRVGEITHLFVNPDVRGHGIGAELVSAYEILARRFGVDRIDLVTMPFEQGGAGRFYERLGWRVRSSITSRSGESFELYEKWLQG